MSSISFQDLKDGDVLALAEFDTLSCCGRPARADKVQVAGAVCRTCLCGITAPGYGPITITRCTKHRS